MAQYCVYLLYRAGIWLLSLLPLPLLFGMGQAGGAVAWLLLSHYRVLASRNVQIAFGDELSQTQIRRLARRHFQRLGANLLCSIKLAEMPIARILERVRVENFDLIDKVFASGRPVVLLLSHVGLWEVTARLMPQIGQGQRKSTIYQPLRNRFIDRHVQRARERFGIETFDRNAGFAKPLQLLRGGGGVGIFIDQHAGDGGIWTPFFGRLASTTPLPALLARRSGAEVLAMAVYTDGFAHWHAEMQGPIGHSRDGIELLTARGNDVIEEQVRRAPEDWFWVHDRWKTPKPNFLLTRYKRGVFRPNATPLKPFRILIRSSNWLGDAVMSVPAVQSIKRGRPDAHVVVLAPEKIAALWKVVPEVDRVIAVPTKAIVPTVRSLRSQAHFDVAVLFPNSLRAALEVALAGVPRRVGFSGHWRRFLLNQCPRPNRYRGLVHHTYKYLELASTIGAPVHTDFVAARSIKHHAPFKLAMCPGAEYGPAKRWLPERFIEVGRQVSANFAVQWILFGTARDKAVTVRIAAGFNGNVVDRAGETTLDQLIAELRECDLLLTNDTGTMHLAALLGVPSVSIFGSTEPKRTGPLGAGHKIMRHHVECSPCFLRECPLDFRCMRAVTAAEVSATIIELLAHNNRTSTP